MLARADDVATARAVAMAQKSPAGLHRVVRPAGLYRSVRV